MSTGLGGGLSRGEKGSDAVARESRASESAVKRPVQYAEGCASYTRRGSRCEGGGGGGLAVVSGMVEELTVRMREAREKDAFMFCTMLRRLPSGDALDSGVQGEDSGLGEGLGGFSGRLAGGPSAFFERSGKGAGSARAGRRPGS